MFEDGAQLLRWMLRQSDPRAANKQLWKSLSDWSEKNGYYKGFYCPYVPLIIDGKVAEKSPVKFKTRYDK